MKFAVFTDLHYDVIHDGDRRITEFIDTVKRESVDFVVGLGDLCYPTEKNKNIINTLKSLGVPCFFNLGNHDSDVYSHDVVLNFFGIEWLKRELEDENFYYVIFSHHSLSNNFNGRGISNREDVTKILEQKNMDNKKVLFCINGHDHGDDVKVLNGIHYYTLNSMAYIWHGTKEIFNYSNEIHKQYPYLKGMILYDEPLHAIVTIEENMSVQIKGMEGHYQNVMPKDVGLGDTWNGVSIKPRTSSLEIEIKII